MVKLIKLNAPFASASALSNENKAQFTAYFNEDIIIKPNSRIALRNIQFSTPNVDDIVAGQGMRVSLKDNANGSKNWNTILMNPNTYQGEELGLHIYEKLNSGFLKTDCPLICTGIYNRVMFDVGYSDKNVMHIDFKFIEDYYNTNLTTSENISYNDTTLEYSKSGNYGEWDYVDTGNLPICLGTGTLDCHINGLDDVNGCAIGIIRGLLPENTPITDDLFWFKVYTEDETYWYKKYEELSVDTGITAEDDDLIGIKIEKGFFILTIVRGDGTVLNDVATSAIFYTEIDYDATQQTKSDYYAYFGLKDEDSKISDIRWTQNPYFSSNENGITKTPQPTPHVVVSSLSDAVPSTVSIDFLQGFNLQIGFNNIYYDLTGVSGSFVGDLSTTDIRLPDGFYVVLDNIRLNSYDFNPVAKIGRRKNILANVTSFDFLTTYNLISYETDAPTFIDMDNKDYINLNSISVSVYDNDNNLLSVGEIDQELTTTLTKTPLKLTLLID